MLDECDTEKISQTRLGDYCYTWGKDKTGSAIVLGNGSLYNHSYQPNAVYEKDIDNAILTIRCYLSIKAQEEITINYNGNPLDTSCVWFEVVEKA